jgi:hypothetical protein
MKPSLYVLKKTKGQTTPTKKTVLRIVVTDEEKGKKYPANFVCILPSQFGFPSCVFEKLYGNKSKEVAKKLLTEAHRKNEDAEVKAEIKRRLRTLESASAPISSSG